jgi:hypothetical protein
VLEVRQSALRHAPRMRAATDTRPGHFPEPRSERKIRAMTNTPADQQATPQAPSAPAGWYPEGINGQRYWDGAAWTEHRAPTPGPTLIQLPAAEKRNGLAAAGFVFSLLGALLGLIPLIGFLVGGIFALAGVVVSIVGNSHASAGGKTLVTFGIVIGALTLIAICFAGMGSVW